MNQLAILGGSPRFSSDLPVGQLYFPSWDRYEAAMRGIFERRYYTNQGPLTNILEETLSAFFGVKHVVVVTNATLGLIMAAKALSLQGKVIVPGFTFIASVQSLTWAGIEPVFCDVDIDTHGLHPASVDALIDKDVSGILATNLWGGTCAIEELQEIALKKGVKLYFDSAHGFGVEAFGRKLGGFGELEVFSFHATKILSATEGGCICTNDDTIAARLRNMRSSYGAGPPVDVPLTSNARMSEAQAAIALMSLEDFESNVENNRLQGAAYSRALADIPGISLVRVDRDCKSNYQYVVCRVDEQSFGLTRDQLLLALKRENVNVRRYFYPGVHRSVPYNESFSENSIGLPNTDKLCAELFQLPVGALVNVDIATAIGELIGELSENAGEIRGRLSQ